MQEIVKYRAFDGKEFDDRMSCVQHELDYTYVAELMKELPEYIDETCNFANGSGYIQHDPVKLLQVRTQLCQFATKYTGQHNWMIDTIVKGFEVDPSWAGRLIGECCPSFLNKAWHRMMCIDKQYREWGQPYFATHPEEAKQKQLN